MDQLNEQSRVVQQSQFERESLEIMNSFKLDIEYLMSLIPEFKLEGRDYHFKINDPISLKNIPVKLISNEYKFLKFKTIVKPGNQFIFYNIPDGSYELLLDNYTKDIDLNDTTPLNIVIDLQSQLYNVTLNFDKYVEDCILKSNDTDQEFNHPHQNWTYSVPKGSYTLLGSNLFNPSVIDVSSDYTFNINVNDFSQDIKLKFIDKADSQPLKHIAITIFDETNQRTIFQGATSPHGCLIFEAKMGDTISIKNQYQNRYSFDPEKIELNCGYMIIECMER